MDQDRSNDWRTLCKAAATELDPIKLMDLVSEIIASLDERDEKRNPIRTPAARSTDAELSWGGLNGSSDAA
jgi:hypothetical protein